MQAPGTRTIIVPPYKAPAFSSPSVSLGSAVTTLVFEDVTPNSPFTIGHVFRKGELAPTDGLVGRDSTDNALQVDVKATHKDGSVRHALISGIVSQNGVMQLLRATKPDTPPHKIAPASLMVTIKEGLETYYAYSGMDGTPWMSGPVANESVGFRKLATMAGVEHPFLKVQINTAAYSTGQARYEVVVEHTLAYETNGFLYPVATATNPTPAPQPAQVNITYDMEVSSGKEILYVKQGLVHYPFARHMNIFWSGGEPSLHVKHNTDYFISTKAVSNYDQTVTVPESVLAGYQKSLETADFGPMGVGRFQPVMSAPGGRPDIGLAPDCFAAAVLTMDKRAKKLMLASARVGGSWAGHRRLKDGTMLDILRYPYASILGNPGDTKNPATAQQEWLPRAVTSSKNSEDTSHQPAFAYIPYLLTGSYFYLEELLFWGNYNLYASNPHFRMFEKGWMKSYQLRGQGWALRSIAQCEYAAPDNHPQKADFKYHVDNNMEYYRVNYTDASWNSTRTVERNQTVVDPLLYNDLGIITNGPTIAYKVRSTTPNGISLFMDDHFTSAIGHVFELGNEEAGRLLMWKGKFQVGRLLDEGYCPSDAVMYDLRVRDSGVQDPVTKLFPPFYSTLKQCRDNTKDPALLACPTELEMSGYPGSPEGFAANYQPALAACVDAGYTDGHKAWNLFMSRKTKPDYGLAPQFAIVPRTRATPVEPPVVVDPPPPVVPPTDPVVPPTDPVTPPVEPPPPVVVQPPIEPDTSLTFTSAELESKTNLSVIVQADGLTKAFITNAVSNVVMVTDKTFLIKGVKYNVTVFDSGGNGVLKISPVKAV